MITFNSVLGTVFYDPTDDSVNFSDEEGKLHIFPTVIMLEGLMIWLADKEAQTYDFCYETN